MKNENDNTIVLHDEEGQEWKFDVIDIITVDNKDYALLMPLNGFEEDEVYVFRIEEDENGDQVLIDLDDEEELAMVEEAWEELVYEEDDETED
ncbi:MAG TPA: DUF1292 domain-containing protein [Thermoanaerobacterales bacterium]|nr:DUF1292 domain-containing protein [Thermoanaerobacterales bacterium]